MYVSGVIVYAASLSLTVPVGSLLTARRSSAPGEDAARVGGRHMDGRDGRARDRLCTGGGRKGEEGCVCECGGRVSERVGWVVRSFGSGVVWCW